MKMDANSFYRQVFGITEPEILEKLFSVTELRSLQKKELLIREGEALTDIVFVVSGVFRSFYPDENGRDITDCFAFLCGDPITAAFDLNSPSAILSIEALTDGEILCIPIEKALGLLRENASLMQIYNRLLTAVIERHWEIKNVLHKQTASERYQWFLATYPGLIDRVAHRYIASFLDMSPVTLSRLRSAPEDKMYEGDTYENAVLSEDCGL